MAGLLSTALVAVSTTVIGPLPAPPPAQWMTAPAASLASAIETWAEETGQPRPRIDPRVAGHRIGQVTLRAEDFCSAVSSLVAALRYAEPRPVVACAPGSPLLTVSARTLR